MTAPSIWFPVMPLLAPRVGAGPGDQWSQAPTEQEKQQGYKKTDVMSLQLKCSALRSEIEGVLDTVDAAATDPASLAALKALHDKVVALETAVAVLATQSSLSKYNQLTAAYVALAAEWAGYGFEESKPPIQQGGGSPPVKQAPTPVKPAASPSSPVIAVKPPSSNNWLLGVSGALVAIGVAYALKLGGVW